MFRLNAIRISLLGLLGGLVWGLPGTVAAEALRPVPICDLAEIETDNSTGVFICVGEMVAERDIAFFTADLLDTYKILKNDERNLTRLFLRCDRSWGATAYALALQAASRIPMDVVLMVYDEAGRDWERTAIRMGLLYPADCRPSYTFGVYLNRQESVWCKRLEVPLRWRRMFLGR
ncbi:hypothetical protein [uncultured Rikenella sp.]|uniref:hypothetical protein n=1 Tax=uncultured Rikenella sp. TaxID=368003 RepID=UPI002631196D|nr:hypothetical protein [uncultured Rikenella sp.]